MAINNLWWRCRYKQHKETTEQPSHVIASLKGVQTKFIDIWGVAVEAKRLSELAAPAAALKPPVPAKKSDKLKAGAAAGGGGGGAEGAEAKDKDKPQPPSLQVHTRARTNAHHTHTHTVFSFWERGLISLAPR